MNPTDFQEYIHNYPCQESIKVICKCGTRKTVQNTSDDANHQTWSCRQVLEYVNKNNKTTSIVKYKLLNDRFIGLECNEECKSKGIQKEVVNEVNTEEKPQEMSQQKTNSSMLFILIVYCILCCERCIESVCCCSLHCDLFVDETINESCFVCVNKKEKVICQIFIVELVICCFWKDCQQVGSYFHLLLPFEAY